MCFCSGVVKWMLLQPNEFYKEGKRGQTALEAITVCILHMGGMCFQHKSLYYVIMTVIIHI